MEFPPTGGEGGPTGCSLKTQLVDHLTIQQQGYTWSEDSGDSTINQSLAKIKQEVDFKQYRQWRLCPG